MSTEVELDSRFPQIIRDMRRELEKDQQRAAGRIAARAKRGAPRLRVAIVYPSTHREPGWLASAITTEDDDGASYAHVGKIPGHERGWAAFWGLFQEHGTEHHRAQPFLEPAATAETPMLIGDVETTLRDLED